MRTTLPKWPPWAEKALQGLAFWIGHRHALYAGYPLAEAALVAETCNLIYTHLRDDEHLACERLYRTLVPDTTWPPQFGARARADLVVLRAPPTDEHVNIANTVIAAIEVKRSSAPRELIEQDLRRLAALKEHSPHIRAMLFIVSEAARPKRFVSAEGKAILGSNTIPQSTATYRVRRACKASAAFSGKETAHYACIIEVFSPKAA